MTATSFSNACLYGNIQDINTFIENGIQNDRDEWSDGFFYACRGGHLEIVQLIISKSKCKIEWKHGIHGACYSGNLKLVHFLISKATEAAEAVTIVDLSRGLHFACGYGHLKLVQFLISIGASWEFGLTEACKRERLEIVHFLISKVTTVREISLVETTLNAFYAWPNVDDKPQIIKLLYLGTPLNVFQQILGFQELESFIIAIKQAIIGTRVMLPDLLNIVAQCIIV